jgi:hypothetical protein
MIKRHTLLLWSANQIKDIEPNAKHMIADEPKIQRIAQVPSFWETLNSSGRFEGLWNQSRS